MIPWFSNSQHTQRTIILQKKAIRHITNAKYNSHTDPLFQNLKLLKIEDLYTINCCKLYLRAKHDLLPHKLGVNLQSNLEFHNINTRQAGDIHVPSLAQNLNNQLSNFKIGQAWNSLPQHLKAENARPQFLVPYLRNHFFESYDFMI